MSGNNFPRPSLTPTELLVHNTMSQSSKSISPVAILAFAAVLGAVVFLGWKISGPTPPPVIAAAAPPKPASTKPSNPAPKTAVERPVEQPPAAPMQPPAATEPQRPKTPEELAYEAADFKMGTIIEQEKTPEATRDKLLLLFPNFSRVEKIAAAPHIVNLTGDEDLPKVVGFLKSPLTPPEAMETFFNDMLNRPPELGWQVLVDLIKENNHPMAGQAKEILTTIVGDDFGNDAAKWQKGLNDQLQAQGALNPPPVTNPQQ